MPFLHKDETGAWATTNVAPGVDELAEARRILPPGTTVYIVSDADLSDDSLFPNGVPDPLTDADVEAAIDALVATKTPVTI